MFFFKKQGKVSRAYQWNELLELGLNENTQIWKKEFCPLENSVEKCKKHWETLKEYKEKRENESSYQENSSYHKSQVYNGWFTSLVVALLFLYLILPTSTSNSQQKKSETKIHEIDIDGKNLKFKVRTTIKNEFFEMKETNDELVKDQKGCYYIVYLKLAYKKEKVLFNAGEYVIQDFNDAFIASFDNFMANVYFNLKDEGVNCHLYVKGSADISGQATFRKKLDERYGSKEGFTQIEYLKALDKEHNLFTDEYKTQLIGSEYSNSELPG